MQQNKIEQYQPQTLSFKPQEMRLSQEVAMEEVNLLFMRMTAIYGQMWLQNFPTQEILKASKAEWANQFKKYTALDIERALQAVIDSGEKFPPNLPVFVKHLRENLEQRKYKTYGG